MRAARRASLATPAGAGAPAPGSLFVSLRDGVGHLVSTLNKSLTHTRIVTGTEITTLSRTADGFRAQAGDTEAEATAVIVATPAHAARKLLEGLDPALAATLGEIPYHSTMTVSLGFEAESFPCALDGFGFVVPRGEGKRMVACTWVSTKFPFRSPAGRVLLRCFLGGARDPAVLAEDDGSILRTVLRELGEIMGIRSQPSFVRIYRWERAMPQYPVGHPRRIEQINRLLSAHPGLFLAGNAYKGIGIPDCIDSASAAALAAIQYLQSLQSETRQHA